MKQNKWIISQEWNDVLFLHYEVTAELLAPHCPFKLDLFNGKAIISIVPFRMNRIRFPYLPAIPGVSNLWELNLRTYVEVNGIKGVYFFTLDTDSLLGEYIARTFFKLPYNLARISARISSEQYFFKHQRDFFNFELMATIEKKKQSSAFDLWATERYSLFTFDHEHIYQGRVYHRPWELKSIKVLSLTDNFSCMLPKLDLSDLKSSTYCQRLEVRFSPFNKIGRIRDSI